jgi:MoaA/NifB/PqqE/SkfB family radical SAM enzyme
MPSFYTWSKFAARNLHAAYGPERKLSIQKIVLLVTKRCHSRCVYCDIWKVKDTPGGLDGELTTDEFAQMAKANPALQWIDFTGGEPTDHPGLADIIEMFDSECPDLALSHFTTNGLATERIRQIAFRLKQRLRSRLVVTVSIDGPPELNDRLRGIKRDFSHAIATFAAVRKVLGPENTYVGMTLHGHTATCGYSSRILVEQTYTAINCALAETSKPPIGWGSMHLNIPHFSQHYYNNASADSRSSDTGDESCFGGATHRSEIAEALQFIAKQTHNDSGSLALKILERAYRNEAKRYLANGITRVPCAALLTTAYVSAKGEVYPCTIWDKPLGNIRDHAYALAPIIQNARETGVRSDVAAGRCPTCWTPCEAFPALAASPIRAARALIS